MNPNTLAKWIFIEEYLYIFLFDIKCESILRLLVIISFVIITMTSKPQLKPLAHKKITNDSGKFNKPVLSK